jgi:hypothetical protein
MIWYDNEYEYEYELIWFDMIRYDMVLSKQMN